MEVGNRLKLLREHKHLSQGDIERRTGLLRCYISRVENGHTVPSIESLEKIARALEMHLYQVLYEGSSNPPRPNATASDGAWGSSGPDARMLLRFRRLLGRVKGPQIVILCGGEDGSKVVANTPHDEPISKFFSQ